MDEFEWKPDPGTCYEYYGRLGTSLNLRAVGHIEPNRGAGYRGWRILIVGCGLPALGKDLFRVEVMGDSRGLQVAKKAIAFVTAKVLGAFGGPK